MDYYYFGEEYNWRNTSSTKTFVTLTIQCTRHTHNGDLKLNWNTFRPLKVVKECNVSSKRWKDQRSKWITLQIQSVNLQGHMDQRPFDTHTKWTHGQCNFGNFCYSSTAFASFQGLTWCQFVPLFKGNHQKELASLTSYLRSNPVAIVLSLRNVWQGKDKRHELDQRSLLESREQLSLWNASVAHFKEQSSMEIYPEKTSSLQMVQFTMANAFLLTQI